MEDCIRVNPDGSITVGILSEKKKVQKPVKEITAEIIVDEDGIVLEDAPKIEKKPTTRRKK